MFTPLVPHTCGWGTMHRSKQNHKSAATTNPSAPLITTLPMIPSWSLRGGCRHTLLYSQWPISHVKPWPATHRERESQAARETPGPVTWRQKQGGWVAPGETGPVRLMPRYYYYNFYIDLSQPPWPSFSGWALRLVSPSAKPCTLTGQGPPKNWNIVDVFFPHMPTVPWLHTTIVLQSHEHYFLLRLVLRQCHAEDICHQLLLWCHD